VNETAAAQAAHADREAQPASHPAIEMAAVSKQFRLGRGQIVEALSGFSLRLDPGQFVAVIGPSGCGKSTALRLLAGLERPDEGLVRLAGRPPEDVVREGRLGVAFQEHALLPWLTVWGNIALPFKIRGKRVDEAHVRGLVELVGLTGFEKARPKHLSGGMRQRVSIARALALHPDFLLLDEPFGSLDAVTRRQLNLELQALWALGGITTVLVTHSVEEAILLADRIAVVSGRPGRVVLEQDVPFTRPRQREIEHEPAFRALMQELTDALDAAAAMTGSD
jgi:NitT/TauT family transport system ATP-binding protein